MSKERQQFIFKGDRVKSELDYGNAGIELGLNSILNTIIRDLEGEKAPTNTAQYLKQRNRAVISAKTQIDRFLNGYTKELIETNVAKPVEVFATSKTTAKFRWVLGKVDSEHCPDCLALSQKPAKTKQEWLSYGLGLPRHGKTECSVGCKCMLAPSDQKKKPSEIANEEIQKETDPVTGVKNPLLAKNMAGKHKTKKEAVAWVIHNLKIPNPKFGTMPMPVVNEIVLGFNAIAKKYRTRADLPDNYLNVANESKQINKDFPLKVKGVKANTPNNYVNYSRYGNLNTFYVRKMEETAHAGGGSMMGFSSSAYGKGTTPNDRLIARNASFKSGWHSSREQGGTLVHEYGHIFTQNHIRSETPYGKKFIKLYDEWMSEKGGLAYKYKEKRDVIASKLKKSRIWMDNNYYKNITQEQRDTYDKEVNRYNKLIKERDILTDKYRKEAKDLQISVYGMSNVHEFVAESFTCHFLGKSSRSNKYIEEVGKLIDEAYKK
tara:strand:+ start:329 stop:1801 length:1473 start_codon:yes stop_codon:yes gene_type:complete